MATIGTFTANSNGFTDAIKTLNLNIRARIERVENPSDKGPQFRVFSGAVEFGAAWQKTAKDTGRDYLSVKSARSLLPPLPADAPASTVRRSTWHFAHGEAPGRGSACWVDEGIALSFKLETATQSK